MELSIARLNSSLDSRIAAATSNNPFANFSSPVFIASKNSYLVCFNGLFFFFAGDFVVAVFTERSAELLISIYGGFRLALTIESAVISIVSSCS